MRMPIALPCVALLGALWTAPASAAPVAPVPPADAPQSLPPIEPAFDTCNAQPLTAKFRITLEREARLVDLVRWMSSVTCTKFIWSPGVRDGKVTIVAPEAVTMQQAHAAFYAALETMGLTVESSGDYLKIVESKDAARQVVPVYGPDAEPPASDRFVTQLHRPQPGRVDDVLAVIEHLKSERGTAVAVEDLVIVTDTGSNVARMMKVIDEVDTSPAPSDAIFLVPLEHAEPEEIAQIVRETFMDRATASGATRRETTTTAPAKGKAKGKPAAAPSTAATPAASSTMTASEARVSALSIDVRTRTLIITAPREDFGPVRRLIERLDVAIPDDGGTMFVLPLRHADPEEIAAVLGTLPTSQRAGGSGSAGSDASRSAGGVSIGGEIHVTADPATRSLVIMASYRDYLALKRVIEALDVERRLVYIEAYILELSTRHGMDTDASAHFGRDVGNGGLGFASSSPGNVNSALLDTSVLSGLAAGVLGPGIPGSGDLLGLPGEVPAFGVVIQALENHEDVNIVSDPHLYTADNKTARMQVGTKIPVPVGTNSFGAAGVPVTQTQYNREEVSLTLEVTPHVGEGGALTLDILIENQEVVNPDSEGGPTTSKRRLELEEVIARDGQPVVLGGLVQEKEQLVRRQVPGLGSIPLIGWLFKKRVHNREKVNLLVVLVPHVLDSPDDARRIHERRLEERRELLERESALRRRDLDTHVNYRHKSGLLASIDAEVHRMEGEAELHAQAEDALDHTVSRQIAPDGVYELTAPPQTEPVPAVAGP